ncbi:MAG: hypothetical protein Q4G26_10260 [Paracoccus sp. (in: a-proteobacteria)]|nr:hypothetical protein [Paracoccus sp. (in: a-proteobacteria)]
MAKKSDKITPDTDEKAARRAKNAENRARREANAAAREARKRKPEKPRPEKPTPVPATAPPDTPPAPLGAVSQRFNILLVVQSGRLEYEAALFVESLRRNAPDWQGRLILAEPRAEAAWAGHQTAISAPARTVLEARGADIRPFSARHFGASYPYGNKIEALSVLPEDEPFIFFDSDTLITGPIDRIAFDFSRPSASMRREGSWPKPPLYGPDYSDIWRALYDRFGLDFASSQDETQPHEHWERFLYFNAGWFFGPDPAEFGRRFLDWSRAVLAEPGDVLAAQELDPWLDQVVLPLVIHSLGGGRPGPALAGLDGALSCHWRKLPLLYARESDLVVDALETAAEPLDIKALLSGWEPAQRLIYQRHGRNALRPAIDRANLPRFEQPLRQQIRRLGWWLV